MLFNSHPFLVFFPLLVLICFFYMCRNPLYTLLLFSTAVTSLSGLLISSSRKKPNKKTLAKWWVGLCFVMSLAVWVCFKYDGFLVQHPESLFGLLGLTWQIPKADLLLPIGISFYIFQALGYTPDVYSSILNASNADYSTAIDSIMGMRFSLNNIHTVKDFPG